MIAGQLFTLVSLSLLAAANPLLPRAASSTFPSPPTTSHLSEPFRIKAGQSYTPSKAYTRFDRGSGSCGGQTEGGDKDAVFILEEGASLSKVVIGKDQAEGIHCLGSCTISDVWFEDVCEDAITIKQTSGTSRILGGGAKHADDKVIQHNGGGKVVVDSFYVEDFGKLYRSCGNCKSTQYKRQLELSNIWAVSGKLLVGINSNYGDTAKIRSTKVKSVKDVCQKFIGNNNGKEPSKDGSAGPDSKHCLYSNSDITKL
ncbi:hypothetical protein VNI00_002208 [Paramarasmius palmivorus]|uniref:Pectate lyase n=1 Tax=Paramarasmius palmivorus TaxID=297713 RepID=A0AAW0E734_9AGAR